MLRQKNYLQAYYKKIVNDPQKQALKLRALIKTADSIAKLPLHHSKRFSDRKADLLKYKNAYFVDFQQYDSMQDSLEIVFKQNLWT